MRVPLDKLWPTAFRWMQVLHLDHLLEFNNRVRIGLLFSCVISLGYSVAWLLDIIQLTCFENTPWKEEGIGRFTCLFYLVGGVELAFMFQNSAMALAYYDESGEELRQRKERFLSEMQKQTGDVLSRATSQAHKLCGMLSADLGEKVNEHVFRMRTILGKIAKDSDPEAKQIYNDLVIQMAHHLHGLRQPALSHFEKLIKLSGQTYTLKETLRKEKHQSMVQLLTGKTGNIPRTVTYYSDSEDIGVLSGLSRFEEVVTAQSSLHEALCCGCCHPHSAPPPSIRRTTSVDAAFTVPTDAHLEEQLRPITAEEQKASPEKVVLQPLRLVLSWFEKIEPRKEGAGSSRMMMGVSTAESALEEVESTAQRISAVVAHLRKSSFYRCLLFGVVCSFGFLLFYVHMLGVCWRVIVRGDCHGQTIVPCFMALVRKVFGILAMSCYMVSLGIVLWNVERLDAVLQVQEEIHEIEDFKRQIDQLNAHDLAEEDSGISLIQSVEKALMEQKALVAAFFNSAWGDSVGLERYRLLAEDLERALNPDQGRMGCMSMPCAHKGVHDDEEMGMIYAADG